MRPSWTACSPRCSEQVRERGLWAAHLPPELGGQGFGQVSLGLMHEILGTSPYAPSAFGCQAPDSGNSELIALAGTAEQKDRWLHPLLAGDLRSAFSMTEPGVAGADPTTLQTRAVLDPAPASGSSTATSGSRRTPRSPTSSSSWRSPSPTPARTSAPR